MTPRIDSDLPVPYGWVDPIGLERTRPPSTREWPYKWLSYDNSEVVKSFREGDENLVKLAKRPKTVAWLVSRKQARSRRDQYVALMQQHTDIDIFGAAGFRSCGSKL